MVERRSIIFSKLLEGLAFSAAAATAAAPAVAAFPATAAGGTASGGLSPLTVVAPAAGGTAAEGPPVLAPAGVLGTGRSDVLGAELLVSAGGWGWGWF